MASKRHIRRKACQGKAKHTTMEHALIALRKTIEFGTDTDGLHAYKCPHCGYHHVGHSLNYHTSRNEKWRWDRYAGESFAC